MRGTDLLQLLGKIIFFRIFAVDALNCEEHKKGIESRLK